jgi:peptidyl-prolyl cis-trans isomerase-like 1
MDKLKSMFGKHDDSSAASSNTTSHSTTTPSAGAQSGGNPANAEGVTLHTTLGDITIALFKDQTPKVSFNGIAWCQRPGRG